MSMLRRPSHETIAKKSSRPWNKSDTHHQSLIGVVIGVILVIITLVLQSVAFFTPHWKEISPTASTLYVDGVDALIRTEVLHYFNSIHRSRHHSYGLFYRCEYLQSINGTTVASSREDSASSRLSRNERKRCTKNYLPSYREEDFNECHSLPYYRFCAKANEESFNIDEDYLRATFHVSSSLRKTSPSSSSCDCHYPPYVIACHVFGIFALIFLIGFGIIFSLFLFFHDPHHRLKLKCFGILIGLFASLSMLINLVIMMQHFSYESIEYLIAIERHYKTTQIYKLSQDTKLAIERFLSTITIRLGYSMIIAWIAFALSIIDVIFFLSTCKISHRHEESANTHSHDQQINANTPLKFEAIHHDDRPPIPHRPPSPPHMPVMNALNETSSFPSTVVPERRFQAARFPVEDEV